MSLLTDKEIKEENIVTPFTEKVKGKISWGVDPAGYTISLSNKWMYPKPNVILDPMSKHIKENFDYMTADIYTLPPKSFVLAMAKEKIEMPANIIAIAMTKSSYARVGIFCNITTIDSGWRGYLTIEIANLGSNFVKIYAGKGIAEVLFFKHNLPNEMYSGKYQDLKNIEV